MMDQMNEERMDAVWMLGCIKRLLAVGWMEDPDFQLEYIREVLLPEVRTFEDCPAGSVAFVESYMLMVSEAIHQEEEGSNEHA